MAPKRGSAMVGALHGGLLFSACAARALAERASMTVDDGVSMIQLTPLLPHKLLDPILTVDRASWTATMSPGNFYPQFQNPQNPLRPATESDVHNTFEDDPATTCIHTPVSSNWWEAVAPVGSDQPLTQIRVHNRAPGSPRIDSYELRVFDDSDTNTQTFDFTSGVSTPVFTFNLDGSQVSRVRIQKAAGAPDETLHFCGIFFYQEPPVHVLTVDRASWTATMSPGNFYPQFQNPQNPLTPATESDVHNTFLDDPTTTCIHTPEANNWWQAVAPAGSSNQPLTRIKVYNRGEGNSRIDKYHLKVFDDSNTNTQTFDFANGGSTPVFTFNLDGSQVNRVRIEKDAGALDEVLHFCGMFFYVAAPTPLPTSSPTGSPTGSPSEAPTGLPSQVPTPAPTSSPTGSPTPSPTGAPTDSPSHAPTPVPTSSPTGSPTMSPTASPTGSPSQAPTPAPTGSPTISPTASPTGSPSQAPTSAPTSSPTGSPTRSPTGAPTGSPSQAPTPAPTSSPTGSPTGSPTASAIGSPTQAPTSWPTQGASVTGDPHVTNVDGVHFDIMKIGVHELLRLPRRNQSRGAAEPEPLLSVLAAVERANKDDCRDTYVKQLDLTGRWLNASGPLHFRANSDSFDGTRAIVLSVNKTLVDTQELGRDSRLRPFLEVTEPKPLPERDLSTATAIQKVILLTVKLSFTAAILKIEWVHRVVPGGPTVNHLNFQAHALRRFLDGSGMDIGGILGRDDHGDAASIPDGCRLDQDLRVFDRKFREQANSPSITAAL